MTATAVGSKTGLLELDGAALTIEDVLEVASGGRRVRLSRRAAQAVQASRQLKHRLISHGIAIYGVTTGFGDSADRQISAAKSAQLQHNLLRFMGCGTGPIAPPEVTRAAILLRANCLAKGNSGVRVATTRPPARAPQRRHPAADPRTRIVRRQRRPGAALIRRQRR